jgi:hypothetical protein
VVVRNTPAHSSVRSVTVMFVSTLAQKERSTIAKLESPTVFLAWETGFMEDSECP